MLFGKDDFNIAKKVISGDFLVESVELKSSKKYSGNDKKLFDSFVAFVWNTSDWPTLNKFNIISRALKFSQDNPKADRAVLAHALEEMVDKIGSRTISADSKEA